MAPVIFNFGSEQDSTYQDLFKSLRMDESIMLGCSGTKQAGS